MVVANQIERKIKIGLLVGKTYSSDRVHPNYRPALLPERYYAHGAEPALWEDPATKDPVDAHFAVDACVGCKILEEYGDEFEVDWIRLDEVSADRLKRNDVNFLLGIDLVTAWAVAHPMPGWDILGDVKIDLEDYPKIKDAFLAPECKVFPERELHEWILRKDIYMGEVQKAGVPILDTLFVDVAEPDAVQLIKEVSSKGWRKFVVKPIPGSWSIGFAAFETAEVLADPKLIANHFSTYKDRYERYLLQEFVEAPDDHGEPFYEIRIYWVNGEYMSAISTHFPVSSQDPEEYHNDGADKGVTHLWRCPPPGPLLERAKEIGRRAMEVAQEHSTFQGKPTTLSLLRTDIGVTAMQLQGLEHEDGYCMFLNEYENLQCDWHARLFLGEPDCIGGNVIDGLAGKGFSMLDRMTEFLVKKAKQLVVDDQEFDLSYMPKAKIDEFRQGEACSTCSTGSSVVMPASVESM